jgi:hypothetical protein
MIVPPGEGNGGALQARCKGGVAAAMFNKTGSKKVATIGVKALNIIDAEISNSYASIGAGHWQTS